MAIASKSKTPTSPLQTALQNPVIAGAGLAVYLAVVIYVLLTLDRRNTWFPLHTTLAFPPLVIAPFLIMGSSLPRIFKIVSILILLAVVVPVLGIYDSTYLELIIQICIFSALA